MLGPFLASQRAKSKETISTKGHKARRRSARSAGSSSTSRYRSAHANGAAINETDSKESIRLPLRLRQSKQRARRKRREPQKQQWILIGRKHFRNAGQSA